MRHEIRDFDAITIAVADITAANSSNPCGLWLVELGHDTHGIPR